PIGTTRPDTTTFMDEDVTGSTTYTYSVDAFDLANDHSAPSAPLTVTTPAASPEFVQGAAASAPNPLPSYTLTLSEAVLAGDLLGPRRRAGRGSRPHRRPAGLGASRKQPEGAVRPRRAERERRLRPRGHPVQRRRPAGGEPDPRHGHQLEHGARHLPSRFHFHDHHAARHHHHHDHPAAIHLQHHVHQHHAAAHLHHAATDDDHHHHAAAHLHH